MRTIKVSFDALSWTYNPIYHHVHIYTRPDELVAIYRVDPTDKKASYVIGAIWHPDTETFSFHS